jgi:alkenylglycerophosphocholine/alkenylglycerophosphoethanolamine hydrolase
MILLLAGATLFAAIDWVGVLTSRGRMEEVAKPLVVVLLAAWVVSEEPTSAGWLVVTGLLLSGIGDLMLLPRFDRFLAGLAVFLAAHLAFVSAFVRSIDTASFSVVPLLLGAGVAIGMWIVVGQRIAGAARIRAPRLGAAVAAYIAALSLMLIAGFAVGSTILAAGALVFATSDALLGWNRFVATLPHGRLLTHVPYHVGQGLIAIWAVGLS